jgi:sugar O-acyltransferase (sialic acid O-acetyltransferase NeuD family)
MKNVVIYGSGSLAREIYDFEYSQCVPRVHFVGYINDLGNDPVFESQTSLPKVDLEPKNSAVEYLICIADPVARFAIINKIKNLNLSLYTYIHPTALISKSAYIADGCIIYPYVVISANAHLGRSVILNTYSGVGHDVIIGDCSTVSAHVDLTGYVNIGDCCFIGSGARVAPRKKIGANSKIGTGVAVIRSLKENSTIFPTPNKVQHD